VAYVYDEDGQFAKRCNTAMVSLDRIVLREEQEAAGTPPTWHRGMTDEALLRKLVEDHHRWTGSLRARDILDHWADSRARFVKVFPHEYKRALNEMGAQQEVAQTIAKAKTAETTRASKSRSIPAK
jgi:glutamate synthase (NADPH) large chain